MVNRAPAGAVFTAWATICVPLAGQSRPVQMAPRLQGESFTYLRYTVGGSLALYWAHRIGAGTVVTGAVGNPDTRYGAVIVGGGTRLRFSSGASLTAILAGATATDGLSARVYLFPKVGAGRLLVTATTAAYQPLSGGSRRQASVNPLAVTIRLNPYVRTGVVATIEVAAGRPGRAGIGPNVQLRLPGGTLSLEAVVETTNSRAHLRASFSGAPRTLRGG